MPSQTQTSFEINIIPLFIKDQLYLFYSGLSKTFVMIVNLEDLHIQ